MTPLEKFAFDLNGGWWTVLGAMIYNTGKWLAIGYLFHWGWKYAG